MKKEIQEHIKELKEKKDTEALVELQMCCLMTVGNLVNEHREYSVNAKTELNYAVLINQALSEIYINENRTTKT